MDCYGKVRLGVARSGWFWQSRIVKLWLGVASSGKFWQSRNVAELIGLVGLDMAVMVR